VRHDSAAAHGREALGAEDLNVLVGRRVVGRLVDDDDAPSRLAAIVAGQRDGKGRAAQREGDDRQRERQTVPRPNGPST
jgi:hypothetical protein